MSFIAICTPVHASLMEAAEKGDVAMLRKVIETDHAEVDSRSFIPGEQYSQTALMRAVFNGHIDAVRYILSKSDGSSVNLITGYGNTALDFAIQQKHHEITALLRTIGAKTGQELKDSGLIREKWTVFWGNAYVTTQSAQAINQANDLITQLIQLALPNTPAMAPVRYAVNTTSNALKI